MFSDPVSIYSTSAESNQYFPAMAGAPAATIANDNIYVFYNRTYLTPLSTYVESALGCMQIPLPANPEQIDLETNMLNTAVGSTGGQDAFAVGSGFIAMTNSPGAATFQNMPYVFFNTGDGEIACCAGLTSTAQTVASSVAAACSPAVIIGPSTTPVVNVDDDNSIDVLYLFYVGSTAELTVDGTTYEVGTLQCRYTTDGVSWFNLDLGPSPSVNSNGVLPTMIDGNIYLFFSTGDARYYTIFPGLACVTGGGVGRAADTHADQPNGVQHGLLSGYLQRRVMVRHAGDRRNGLHTQGWLGHRAQWQLVLQPHA